MEEYNLSIIIPTWNRSAMVERLLETLLVARENYRYGQSEVLIVDSSQGEEKWKIESACRKYRTIYIEGDDSVRKKRNKGVREAKYDYILFVDSDVTVDSEILNCHMRIYAENHLKNLGGTFGLTEFVGEDNFLWKVIQYSTFIDSFQFAKKFPYQNWTIGNNVSFRKKVLMDVGLFEENFPYKLGADDLELTYRITKAGYLIRSAPDAVTYHSKETWKKYKAINERAKRWGSMEYYLEQRHPEIFITRVPKTELVIPLVLVVFILCGVLKTSWTPMLAFLVFLIMVCFGIWHLDTKGNKQKNLLYYFGAKCLEASYYYSHVAEGLKHKSLCGVFKCLSFSAEQTKHMLEREMKKMWIIIVAMIVSGMIAIG